MNFLKLIILFVDIFQLRVNCEIISQKLRKNMSKTTIFL